MSSSNHSNKNKHPIKTLDDLSKEELKELVRINARNFLALDGVWFQSVEQKEGMDEAMHHDRSAWRRYTETEARRLKNFLNLPDSPGLDGLEQALMFRFSAFANPKVECIRDHHSLIYRVIDCQVQSARKKKGMPYHPCQSVGIIEHYYFAKIIDERIECETVSCYPDVTDDTCACSWRFTIKDESSGQNYT
ncbi:MAG: DUF6125 family protein [Bacteroidales bacterium]|jgi:hypothetical protein|nr:DUF6125 family protein [Bacteroidales bacterium]